MLTHKQFQHILLQSPLHTILFLSVPAKRWFINQHRELRNNALLQSKLISLQTCAVWCHEYAGFQSNQSPRQPNELIINTDDKLASERLALLLCLEGKRVQVLDSQ